MIVGIGVDIIKHGRVKDIYSRHGKNFLEKVLTPNEINYCLIKKDPVQSIAVRIAAKEACYKSLTQAFNTKPSFTWKTMEIVLDDNGSPSIKFSGDPGNFPAGYDSLVFHVSLSHSKTDAIAIVILEKY